ncbi:uncharacterized protein LOC117182579 [Belonocnema kinseyi]|uniref:uncharacterized protein LOC117182579 n=1 Tax=Belonocnema kinseyi TaxID=2817044 RepID=UPI00143CED0E|nr:uncharacterized protein LOC117182579 [Belonocnema kinseyi]
MNFANLVPPTSHPSTNTSDLREIFPSIHRVAVRLPAFWPDDPEMWFVQIEQQFLLAGITSEDTKFSYVAGHLEPKYAAEVRDILTNPPSQNRYVKLKTELIKRLSESQENKVKRLLEHEEIGDRKPSQILRHLRSYAGSIVSDEVLRPLWLSRLPSTIQAILASRSQSPLDDMAELADAIAETITPRGRVAEMQVSNPESLETLMQCMILVMTSQIEEVKNALRQEISAATANNHNRFRGRSRNRSFSRDSRDRSQSRKDGRCWYHRKFGECAVKCTKPCSYSENSQTGR